MPNASDMPTVYVDRNADGTWRVCCTRCPFDDSLNINKKIAYWTGEQHLEWHAIELGLA